MKEGIKWSSETGQSSDSLHTSAPLMSISQRGVVEVGQAGRAEVMGVAWWRTAGTEAFFFFFFVEVRSVC